MTKIPLHNILEEKFGISKMNKEEILELAEVLKSGGDREINFIFKEDD